MSLPEQAAPQAEISALSPLLVRYFQAEASAPVTLMNLLIETRSLEDSLAQLAAVNRRLSANPLRNSHLLTALTQLVELAHANRSGCERIVRMLRSNVDSDDPAASIEEGITFCKRLFDWSVQQNPEASVALYSLGNPDILAAATAEIVARMAEWNLLGGDATLLEIGCGIGRLQYALNDKVKHITGIDVAPNMIAAARARCAGLANVALRECSGYDLAQFSSDEFDVVFATDSFPYLFQSGMSLVETHFYEAARVLRPHGDFLILNFSYRDDLDADRRDVARLAEAAGFEIVIHGRQMFSLWDGAAFHLKRKC